MESKADATARFLREFKAIIATARGLDIIPRAENNQTILDLGLNQAGVRSIILGLSVTDYCEGPIQDNTRPGEVWIFGSTIDGTEIYIKLKIASAGNIKLAKCISFHTAEFPLHYPLR